MHCDDDDLLTVREAADLAGLRAMAIYQRLHRNGAIPEPVRDGERLFFKRADVEDWIASGAAYPKRGRPRLFGEEEDKE